MRKGIWATAAAIMVLSNLSVAAELEPSARRTDRKVGTAGGVVYLPTELRLRLAPSCHESFFALLLHCSPQINLYPPYDSVTVIRLKTLWPAPPKPYPQPFAWSRNE
jgi:hypothetical protein